MYDGFISYSHAADGLLAPRLQAGLQKFAKPWWKRRAVRMFRDESSLAANPHLWSSIVEALDSSQWFVLLLSQDAASSEWVGREIEHWVQNHDPSRILPVVTSGEFGWADGDVTGSSVPPALRGVFLEEPRWVDLRFAKGDELLDLKNPDFSSAIADVSSAIRGIPKDELASEEVRQHRRTVRTAGAAGILVAGLGVTAAAFGAQSAGNAQEAQRQANVAEQNAQAEAEARADAEKQRNLAQENEQRAIDEARRADGSAELAKARELAASAIGVVEEDPRLATLLAMAAIDATPEGGDNPVEVVNALWEATIADPLEVEIPLGFDGYSFVDISPDGRRLAVSSAAGAKLELRDAESFDVLWTYSEQTEDAYIRPVFSPDGSLIALDVTGVESGSPWAQGSMVDELPDRVLLLDVTSGDLVTVLDFPDCSGIWGPAWSPSGRLLAVSTAFDSNCPRSEVDDPRWIEVFDTTTWESLTVLGMPEGDNGVRALFLSEDHLGAFRIQNPLEVYDTSTFELVEVLEDVKSPITAAVSRPAGLVASHSNFDLLGHLYDLESGAPLDILGDLEAWPEIPYGASFSWDGRLLAFATGGRILVWDLPTGEQIYRLTSNTGASNAVFSPDGTRLYSGHQDGVVRVWSLRPGGSVVRHINTFPAGSFVNGNSFSIGTGIGTVQRFLFDPFSVFIEVFSTETGDLVAPPVRVDSDAIALADDRLVLLPEGADRFHFYDARSGESEPIEGAECAENQGCFLMRSADLDEFAVASPIDEDVIEWHFFDADTGVHTDTQRFEGQGLRPWQFGNRWLLHSDGFSNFVFLDRETGDELLRVPMEARQARTVSHDGRTVILSPGQDILTLVDTATWDTTVLDLGLGRMRGFAFSDDDSMLAVADEDAVSIIDLVRQEILQRVPFALVSDIHWISDSEILIGNRDGTLWGTVTLDTDRLIELARQAVQDRPLTAQECSTYRIDPCPTLEEMRER